MGRALLTVLLIVASGCDTNVGHDAGARDGGVRADAGHSSGDGGDDASAPDADVAPADGDTDAGAAPITPEMVLARLGDCAAIGGDYATDSGEAETISVCGVGGVVWWQSDMDIDCDGGRETSCMDDPWYLPETSATDSSGAPLDANTLPFVVIRSRARASASPTTTSRSVRSRS